MKILFWGETAGGSGPANVNKMISESEDNTLIFIKNRRKIGRILEAAGKCLISDVTVISGVSRMGCLLAFLARRSVYIMHGCAAREAEADSLDVPSAIRQERYLMRKADLLLCVSRTFRDWIRETYPKYSQKTDYLHPCAENSRTAGKKIPGRVIAAGGDSAIKNNAVVAAAVEALNGCAELEIYGDLRRSSPGEAGRTRWMGAVSHEDFLQKLAQSEIFVLNSRFETFSLTAVEALCCGCSVLISQGAGVKEILQLRESDVIHDPDDPEEIQEKLWFLLKNPNNSRLLNTLDTEALSAKAYIRQLEEKCVHLAERGRGR